jgi:hypothetical protein
VIVVHAFCLLSRPLCKTKQAGSPHYKKRDSYVKEAAWEPQIGRHPWRFMLTGMFLMTILTWIFSQFLLPSVVNVYEDFGAALPTISQYAIMIGHRYSSWGIALSIMVVLFATCGYLISYKRTLRYIYSISCLILGVMWMLFFVAGGLYPLVSLLDKVK